MKLCTVAAAADDWARSEAPEVRQFFLCALEARRFVFAGFSEEVGSVDIVWHAPFCLWVGCWSADVITCRFADMVFDGFVGRSLLLITCCSSNTY